MTAAARRALAIIQECLASDRVVVLPHFLRRLDQRGLFWPDVQAVIEPPKDIRPRGRDAWDRPIWVVNGKAADGLDLAIVCALDHDDRGKVTTFITIHWQD